MQIDLNVQRINIILARGISTHERKKFARKVAAMTIADLEFSAHLGSTQKVKGSLGGAEVLDLTPECTLHQCVLSIGDCKQDGGMSDNSSVDSDEKAFSFTFTKPAAIESVGMTSPMMSTVASSINIDMHIASARYVHSTEFLTELSLCAGDFHDYAASMARSLQTAAADVAKGFVTAKREPQDKSRSHLEGSSYIDDVIDGPRTVDRDDKAGLQITLQLCIDTPVIAIPRTFNSPDLLVGNLGQITIRNSHIAKSNNKRDSEGSPIINGSIDRIILDIDKVSMYSITLRASQIRDLTSRHKATFDFLKQRLATASSPFTSPAHESFRSARKVSNLSPLAEEGFSPSSVSSMNDEDDTVDWLQILHETGFQLVIDRFIEDDVGRRGSSKRKVAKEPSFQIEGKIFRAFRLELSSKTYNQVLETLNAISATHKPASRVNSTKSGSTKDGTSAVG